MLTAQIGSERKYNYFSDNFAKAFHWLKTTDLKSLTVGNYPIDGNHVYANVQEYTTMKEEECDFEGHRKYYDIQYVVDGVESFGYAPVKELDSKTGYDQSKDLEFFQAPKDYGSIVLHEGEFAIVSPEDAHRPRVVYGKPCKVKKIVLKVQVEE